MGWKQDLHDAMTRFVQQRVDDCIEVTSWDESNYSYENSYGFPESYYELDIYYKNTNGFTRIYSYDGHFVDLIDELTEE